MDELVELEDLRALVAVGNDGHDRFVEAAAHQFHLSALDERGESREEIGMMLLDPFQQETGIVQPDPDSGMDFQHVEKGAVRLAISLFDDVIEVSDRLVRVQQKRK